jgi:hypothetical protein
MECMSALWLLMAALRGVPKPLVSAATSAHAPRWKALRRPVMHGNIGHIARCNCNLYSSS